MNNKSTDFAKVSKKVEWENKNDYTENLAQVMLNHLKRDNNYTVYEFDTQHQRDNSNINGQKGFTEVNNEKVYFIIQRKVK
jgi:hypothetical protein